MWAAKPWRFVFMPFKLKDTAIAGELKKLDIKLHCLNFSHSWCSTLHTNKLSRRVCTFEHIRTTPTYKLDALDRESLNQPPTVVFQDLTDLEVLGCGML